MDDGLSPPKVLLLAVHLAAHADVEGLGALASRHVAILLPEILLRIVLTHLPETVEPSLYVPLIQSIADEDLSPLQHGSIDTSPVEAIADEIASKKARKLHLLQLSCPDIPTACTGDIISQFLFSRTYKMNSETGIISLLPDLLLPFSNRNSALHSWIASTVLPYVRRNYEYHTADANSHVLADFEKLSDAAAVDYLLSQTGVRQADHDSIGRDFRGLIGPWLYNSSRWKNDDANDTLVQCPGWEQALERLLVWNSKSWPVTVGVIEQWGGPRDIDFGNGLLLSLEEDQQQYLEETYTRAALAAACTIPEATPKALEGAYSVCQRARMLIGQDCEVDLDAAMSNPSCLPSVQIELPRDVKMVVHLRNNLLHNSNPLTTPTSESLTLISTITLSAYISTKFGAPWNVRRATELFLLQDERDQKSEVSKLIRFITSQAPVDDEGFWIRARQSLLWLHSWDVNAARQGSSAGGVLSAVRKEYIESEILKSLLSKSMYSLARVLYEEQPPLPLSRDIVGETVYASALNAFDNASNPNRTRGGLKKCDEIIHAFPETLTRASPFTNRIEALLKASHALSDYRLVLKQGEPFSPVVLRVHSDPVAIVEKVLEQNPRAYTRLNEFLEMGTNIVLAGLLVPKGVKDADAEKDKKTNLQIVEKRIISMCIEAALREDDFETAYSYVVSRLSNSSHTQQSAGDGWSWRAALKAGEYVRTERSQQPTHLGTASGNLEIRHLEQRIECLSTALRVAPSPELQNILKSFRRCEEQLDSAIKEEAANEAAWDAAGDIGSLPGAFDSAPALTPSRPHPPRNMTATTAAKQAEEAPMSLFDLSRATARIAQRNFTVLSGTPERISHPAPEAPRPVQDEDDGGQRVRRRDQFRDAATDTLVSGVGWLIGANVNRPDN